MLTPVVCCVTLIVLAPSVVDDRAERFGRGELGAADIGERAAAQRDRQRRSEMRVARSDEAGVVEGQRARLMVRLLVPLNWPAFCRVTVPPLMSVAPV